MIDKIALEGKAIQDTLRRKCLGQEKFSSLDFRLQFDVTRPFMSVQTSRLLAVVVSILSVPALFFGFLAAHIVADRFLGSIEVSRFIREHRSLVARCLANPKVHSFSFSHLPNDDATLLISVDVADRATYEILEGELTESWRMRFLPQWRIKIRNGEPLREHFGVAAFGIGEFFEGIDWMARSAILAIVIPGVSLFFTLCRCGERPKKKRYVDKILS